MKYSRKSYRKKASYRRKRTFKKKGRKANPMMNAQTGWTKQSWTQSYALNNSGGAASPYCTFVVDALGNSFPPPASENYHSMATTQAGGQGLINPSMQKFTITAVAVKLIFPENFAGNNPLSWCMSYLSGDYTPNATVQGTPSILQLVQGSQTGPIPANRVVSRYFKMDKVKKSLGISYSDISAGSADFTFYGQLTGNRPFIQGWVQNAGNIAPTNSCGTQIQVTYYARYQQLF